MVKPLSRPEIAATLRPVSISYTQLNNEELLCRVTEWEDYEAFENLFHRFYPMLCQHVYRFILCEHKAEEIVSDVFIKVWNNRHKLVLKSKVKSYLYTAVRNQAIDYLRKQVKERKINGEISHDYRSEYASPADLVISKETEHIVEAAIEALPPQGRRIFRMSRDKGLKYREIAEILDISIKTVETHMRRSLIFLRREVFSKIES